MNFYRFSRMREGTPQFWWDEVLPSMGIIRVSGGIPETTFTSPVSPHKKKKIHSFLEIYLRQTGKSIHSAHYADSHGTAGKWKGSLQYYISLFSFKFTRENFWALILRFTNFPARLWNVINTSRYLIALIY
jgi:hypothetical protein